MIIDTIEGSVFNHELNLNCEIRMFYICDDFFRDILQKFENYAFYSKCLSDG